MAYSASKKAEALRLKQMNLQSARDRRQTMRESLVARARALNASAAGGIEGSGVSGGVANIQSQAGGNIQGTNQGQEIGLGMFKANSQLALGQTLSSLGAGISNFSSYFSGSSYEKTKKVATNQGWGF